jgi:hypothetical protein
MESIDDSLMNKLYISAIVFLYFFIFLWLFYYFNWNASEIDVIADKFVV